MTTADNIASLGLLAGFVHTAAIGLLDAVFQAPPPRQKYRTGAGFTVPHAPVIRPIEDEEALLLFLL